MLDNAICQQVASDTDYAVITSRSTMYHVAKRLLADGWIEVDPHKPDVPGR